MKKTLFPIVLLSALLTIFSCDKSFDANEEGLVASSEAQTFTATIESDDNSKTILNGKAVEWVSSDKDDEKDKITIVDNNGTAGVFTAAPKDNPKQATFTWSSGGSPKGSSYKAYYPYTIYSGGTLTLPAEQICDGTFALNPMYASSTNTSLEFKNICSVIKLKTDIANVTKIELSTTDKNLSGTFTIGDNYAMTMTGTNAADKKVKLSVSNSPTAIEGYYYYYIAIPPQKYGTLVIKITDNNSSTKTMAKKMPSTSLARNTIYSLTFKEYPIPVTLPGVFTVADGKKVKFSRGNLQAELDASGHPTKWKFAEHQYDYIGAEVANNSIGTTAGTFDLFGWSGSNTNHWGISTSKNNIDYSGDKLNDWGSNEYLKANLGDGWYTLSDADWQYLIDNKKCKHGVTVCGKACCVVIAPDGKTNDDVKSYDETAWAELEAQGFVCLPAAGNRYGSDVYEFGSSGRYWSSTPNGTNSAYHLKFDSSYVLMYTNYIRAYGLSVRLVRESE